MIIAATGHRPDKLGGYDKLDDLVRFARGQIYNLSTVERIITGMAQGWDTAVALAAIEFGIPFTAAVPHEGQEKLWPDVAIERYQSILEKADKVHVVRPGGFGAWKYQRRNEWMVDRIKEKHGTMLALWDGSNGGTANCVKYAQRQGVRIVNVWRQWQERE